MLLHLECDEEALPYAERFRQLWTVFPCPGDAKFRVKIFGYEVPKPFQVLLQSNAIRDVSSFLDNKSESDVTVQAWERVVSALADPSEFTLHASVLSAKVLLLNRYSVVSSLPLCLSVCARFLPSSMLLSLSLSHEMPFSLPLSFFLSVFLSLSLSVYHFLIEHLRR